jgi:hypothetical protein
MNIVAKLIAVKYPRFSSIPGKKSDIIDIIHKDTIKQIISEYLFVHDYDYVVINYNNQLHVCEKSTDKDYSRRSVLYHPLMNDLKIV